MPRRMGPRMQNWLEMRKSFFLMTEIPFALHADCKSSFVGLSGLTRDIFAGECDEDGKAVPHVSLGFLHRCADLTQGYAEKTFLCLEYSLQREALLKSIRMRR